MKPRPVVVTWVDAHADANGWCKTDELDRKRRKIRTCGFLLEHVKPGHVTVAQSVDGDHVDSVLHIPAINVEKVRRL